MKKILFVLALISTTTFAAPKSAPMRSVNEASNTSSYLGVSTDAFATGTVNPGLSALFNFSDKVGLQVYAAIDGTTPKFGFGVGGNIKVSVIGNSTKGFHIGGGFGLGSTLAAGTFFANIYGLLGLHFPIVDSVMVVADGGVGVTIMSGATTFRMGTPGILGLSLLFRL